MRRVKLTLTYDGTAYRGFQVQPNGPTVQSVAEETLSRLLQEPVRLRAAGRTDAGVHAREQVVDFADSGNRPPEMILRGGNALLPRDIRILSAEEVPLSFDARRYAKEKEYRYFLHLHPVASPFFSRHAWHIEKPLDVGSIREALAHIVGEHDFASFRGQGCNAKTTVRTIFRAELGEVHPVLRFIALTGDGFLRHMVRNIAGTLVDVGKGKYPPERVRELFSLRDRSEAGPTAPAHGLFLWSVTYPGERSCLPSACGGIPHSEGAT
ncbi:MAG TPA: tRNA pseudouridine(38-40) synthase TruA [Candidatus Limnocylindrales bacterium]|nr:tRNA pseudouridine(38-40) synthase TruA [Candidatus Limnocylindrales bacterium]